MNAVFGQVEKTHEQILEAKTKISAQLVDIHKDLQIIKGRNYSTYAFVCLCADVSVKGSRRD